MNCSVSWEYEFDTMIQLNQKLGENIFFIISKLACQQKSSILINTSLKKKNLKLIFLALEKL